MILAHEMRSGGRKLFLMGVLCLGTLLLPAVARADVITDVNNALINIIQNTTTSLIDGPPEAANEIALVDSAMFDAVNAASGSPIQSINYTGGSVAGADPNAAALQAALTVMDNLYIDPSTSLYQQYAGVKGSSYFSPTVLAANPAYANDQIGPTTAQIAAIDADVTSIQNELTALGNGSAVTTGITLGTAAGNATIAVNDASGSQAAMLETVQTPYTPPDAGAAGEYVPPSGRPAMESTWGGVTPQGGITTAQIQAVDTSLPGQSALTSQAYALEVLQTECEGASTDISSIEATCQANGFAPEGTAEAQAALFWNDPGQTATPPGHWLAIADTVTQDEGLDLLMTARATALVGIALEDAGIAAWGEKYANAGSDPSTNPSWRPITAIQDCSDWSSYFTTCDSTWASLIATPPHPDYIAGHPAFSGAAATALADAIGTDDVTFSSASQNYCNTGTTTYDSEGNVIGCTVNSIYYSVSGAGCADGGTPTLDTEGNVIGCTLNGQAESVTGGGCNNSGSVPVLNSDGTVDASYNASPLICSIGETFTSLSQASSGYLGAEFSRVVGGIHTPDAVQDALTAGDEVGTLVADDDMVPEPPMAPVLASAVLMLGLLHRRRKAGRDASPGV